MSVAPDASPVWANINSLVNTICDSRLSASPSGTAIEAAWQQLDLPWTEWSQDGLVSVSDIATWLARYQQYLVAAQQNASSILAGAILSTAEQELATLVPSLDFTNVTYSELLTDYNTIYSQFLIWYNDYFGA
jgi:hypothetical protein